MIRAVIDASVLISGVISRSQPSRTVVLAIVIRKFEMVMSAESLAELERYLERPSGRHARVDQEVARVLVDVVRQLPQTLIDDRPSPIPVRDTKDEHIVSTALVGEAEYIVTLDNDLLVLADDLRPYRVEVVSPARFVEVLEGG